MHATVRDRLAMRARARALGDRGLERACNMDLARFGYQEPESAVAVVEGQERAVPAKPKRTTRRP